MMAVCDCWCSEADSDDDTDRTLADARRAAATH
jgi:hypothetical protein